jgi:hypothetical protein
MLHVDGYFKMTYPTLPPIPTNRLLFECGNVVHM